MIRRIIPFAFAGVIGLIVDTGLLLLSAPILGPFGGRLLSFMGAVLTTWLINRKLAFADKAATVGKRREFARYFFAMLPGAAVNWLAYSAVVLLAGDSSLALVAAVAAGSVAGMFVNLLAADRLVFRQRD